VFVLFAIQVNKTEYRIADLGYILILAGLLFLFGLPKDKKEKVLYWVLLLILLNLVIRGMVSWAGFADSLGSLYQVMDFVAFFGLPLSVILFCWMMAEIAVSHSLRKSIPSWRFSTVLSVFCYGIPTLALAIVLLLQLAGLLGTRSLSFHVTLGNGFLETVGAILLFAVEAAPVVHILVSYGRTLDDAQWLKEHPIAPEEDKVQVDSQSRTNVL
jgi:hypothetical protein